MILVAIYILSSHHPQAIELVSRSEAHQLSIKNTPRELPFDDWQLRIAGEREVHQYRGALSVRPVGTELEIVVRVELEDYVARVISAETVAGTPSAALRAQAIVSRSYALARKRHEGAHACDLTHCQRFPGTPPREEARRASEGTRGLVLRLESGAIADAVFHAACGGHTGDPRQLFGADDHSGARAVADPQCDARWQAKIERSIVERITAGLLGTPATLENLRFERGRGGFVVRVVEAMTGRMVSGDAFARALDGAVGWGQIRSSRFEMVRDGDLIFFRGDGVGHGAGLCQAGAVRMGRAGAGEGEILKRFFPATHVGH